MKECKECGKRFSPKYAQTRICSDECRANRLKANLKRHNLLRRYGITEEEWQEMFERQGKACAICRSTNAQRSDRFGWVVDHCHETGKIRAILCNKCNLGLGAFDDNEKLLFDAACYVLSFRNMIFEDLAKSQKERM